MKKLPDTQLVPLLKPTTQLLTAILASIWLSPLIGNAQHLYHPQLSDGMLEPWRYAHFPELSTEDIQAIASSGDESFWFAVKEGVMHYDGYAWKLYDASFGLMGGGASSVMVNAQGEVYSATSAGLFQFDAVSDQWRELCRFHSADEWLVTSIYHLTNGALASTTNHGLVILTGERQLILSTDEQWQSLKYQEAFTLVEIPRKLFRSMELDFFSDIIEPEPGKLWVGINGILDESGDVLVLLLEDILKEEILHYDLLSELTGALIGHDLLFHQMMNGDIWIVNKGNKTPALRFRAGQWERMYYGEQFGDDEYSESITQTADGTVWIGGIGNLYAMDQSGQWSKYAADKVNLPQAHLEVHADKAHLWIYGHKSTVHRVDLSRDTWQTYEHLNFAGAGADGTEWFLDVEGKAVAHERDQWQAYTVADGLIDSPVRLFLDSNGVPWLIGSDNGVAAACYLYKGRWVKKQFDQLSWGLDYRAICQDQLGKVWLGGCTDVYLKKGQTGGVIRMEGDYEHPIYTYFPARQRGLEQQNVYGIAQSADGRVWIGGTTLNYWEEGSWHQVNHESLHDFVNIVQSDAKGQLYVGSRQSGLLVYASEGQWEGFNVGNALKSNNVISIAKDSTSNKLWIATDRDISLLKDGIWSNDVFPENFNLTYEGGAILNGADGELWINHAPRSWNRRVFTGRLPDDLSQKDYKTFRYRSSEEVVPETEITLYNPDVDPAGNTAIFWSGNHFFHQVPANKLRYSYRLNEGAWSVFSKDQTHTFTGLSDGSYLFEVRSKDPQGNIDPTPATVRFVVAPSVWKQTWFMLLILGFIALLGFFQFQILRKRQVLKDLNDSLKEANDQLEHRNAEIEKQKTALEGAVDKIDHLSKAKISFFTNITHEFRTPLSLILGPLEKLSESESLEPATVHMYDIIRRNALRLQRLINQLLEVRRIETGTLELHNQEGDLVHFVKEVKDLFNGQAQAQGINYSFHSTYVRYTINFDRDKVEKILFNLLSNALKHTQTNDRIVVSILSGGATGMVKIKVEDTGVGMSEDTLKHVFERYFTDGINGEGHYQSSGIGLSYIKDLVEAHQGQITVNSELGVGTSFTIILPDNLKAGNDQHLFRSDVYSVGLNAAVLPTGYVSSPHKARTNQTALIVEDNEDMLHFLEGVVADEYKVLCARNGREAMQVLETRTVDMIISDVMMPEIDGMEFCKLVKKTASICHIPVILLTAMSTKDGVKKGYESGADSYLTKPFSPDLLKVRMRNLRASRKALQEQFRVGGETREPAQQLNSYDDQFLISIAQIIKENAENAQFDVAQMCEMSNMSHMHFIRKVKQLTGKKPVELLKEYRMNLAKELLAQRQFNISQIAFRVGYELPNSFTRAFKGYFGYSPSEYLKT